MEHNFKKSVKCVGIEMVKKLEKNKHKGGWSSCTPEYLSRRLGQELKELRSIMYAHYHHSENTKIQIIRECADIANFAMMIAENVGGLNHLSN